MRNTAAVERTGIGILRTAIEAVCYVVRPLLGCLGVFDAWHSQLCSLTPGKKCLARDVKFVQPCLP
jgi:hypothetical protein